MCIYTYIYNILGGTGFKGTLSTSWWACLHCYSSFQNAKLLKLLFQLKQQLQLPDFFLFHLRKSQQLLNHNIFFLTITAHSSFFLSLARNQNRFRCQSGRDRGFGRRGDHRHANIPHNRLRRTGRRCTGRTRTSITFMGIDGQRWVRKVSNSETFIYSCMHMLPRKNLMNQNE